MTDPIHSDLNKADRGEAFFTLSELGRVIRGLDASNYPPPVGVWSGLLKSGGSGRFLHKRSETMYICRIIYDKCTHNQHNRYTPYFCIEQRGPFSGRIGRKLKII